MDKSIDPCVDLYHYSCGGWQQKNPIPPDQTSWSVYAKLYQDNLTFLRGMLEQAAQPDQQRNAVTQKIGDFYAACMDEERRGKTRASRLFSRNSTPSHTSSRRKISRQCWRGCSSPTPAIPIRSSMLFKAGSTQDPGRL